MVRRVMMGEDQSSISRHVSIDADSPNPTVEIGDGWYLEIECLDNHIAKRDTNTIENFLAYSRAVYLKGISSFMKSFFIQRGRLPHRLSCKKTRASSLWCRIGIAFVSMILVGITGPLISVGAASASTSYFNTSPPFNECPAVRSDSSCGILIDVTSSGASVLSNPSMGPFDGADDTLIGIVNNSDQVVYDLALHSSSNIFGFDGDGVCHYNSTYCYGPTGYEGPGVTFSGIGNGDTSGTVNFTPGLAPGASGWFSLEESLVSSDISVGSGQSIISILEQGVAPNKFEKKTTCSTNNPVNCATGDFWHTFTDADIPGLGVPLTLSRTYNSDLALQNGPFGYGWTSNLSMSLSIGSSGDITVLEGDGSQVSFTPIGNGLFSAPSRVLASLIQNSDGTYTLTDQRTLANYIFSASGQLEDEVAANGKETTFTYNAANQLIKVTDASGRYLTFSYGTNGDVSSVTDPMGRVTSYAYDSSGNLISVTDPMGRVTKFTYNSGHLLTTMTDPGGGTLTNTYDSSGRVIAQSDPMGRVTKFSYSGNPATSTGSTTVMTDPDGNVITHVYKNLELVSVTRGSQTASPSTWTYTYDPFTLGITSVTDPNGHVTQEIYDRSGNLLSLIDALGNTTTYAYNSLNEVTCMALPEATTPCSELNPPASIPAGTPIITPPSSIPPPFVTYSQYDSDGNLIWTTTGVYPPGLTTPLYAKTSYNLYNGESVTLNGVTDSCDTPAPSSSLACATINPDGVVTQITYNQDGDAIKLSSPDTKLITSSSSGTSSPSSSGELSVITSTYDADGELTSVVSPDGNVPGANKANYTTTYTYDADGELTQKVQGSSSANITPRVTKYSYDANGNNTSISSSMSPHFVGADSATSISSPTSKPNINLSLPAGSSSGDEQVLTVTATAPAKSVVPSLSSGDITTYVGDGSYGSSGMGGQATSAPLNGPYSVAATSNGNLALADRNNSVIDFVPATSGTYFGQQMTAGDIYRIAGNGTFGDAGLGGPATSAQLNGPGAVAFDGAGNLYISDTDNSQILMVPATSGTYFGQQMTAGDIYLIAGNGIPGDTGNGGPAVSAQLDGPQGISVTPSGALLIADTNNNVIRMVPATSGTYFGQQMTAGDIYTVVGNGSYGLSGLGGPATSASLNGPSDVTTDTFGNMFFSDHNNNAVDMVPATSGTYFGQQMTAGDIYRVAGDGSGGDSGDMGPATSAS